MFDFRYHAVSLAAVFIALVVGLLLGVAIGDANLVSNAEHKLQNSLRRDLSSARGDASTLRSQLDTRTQYETASYPALVRGRLKGRRIGLLFLGGSSEQLNQLVRSALEPTGAQVVLVAVLRDPVDTSGVAAAAKATRYGALNVDPTLLRPFGVRIGAQLARGGRLIQRLQSQLLSSYNGTLEPLSAIVIARDVPASSDPVAAAASATFEAGVAAGMTATHIPVVGVETTSTQPSEVPWFKQENFSSVDDLDDIAGRTALVFALSGASGAYGVKPTAQALLPASLASSPPAP